MCCPWLTVLLSIAVRLDLFSQDIFLTPHTFADDMATGVTPSFGAGPAGSLGWQSGAGTVDEALNQREFEHARQSWLASGAAPVTTVTKPRPAPGTSAAVGAARKSALDAKSRDRADLLLAETRRMEERLCLLRQTMSAEK